MFNKMAAEFQASRKAKNNVWGSILQEESLTSEMTSIGVGGRSLKDLDSDRGAETYDYHLAQEQQQQERERGRQEHDAKLDEDLDDYFSRKNEAIQAGKKRKNIKDRLGKKRPEERFPSRELDDMSIPPPGVPRNICDIEDR